MAEVPESQPLPSTSGPVEEADGFGEVPPEDPDLEFATREGEHPSSKGPRVINVGIPGPGVS